MDDNDWVQYILVFVAGLVAATFIWLINLGESIR